MLNLLPRDMENISELMLKQRQTFLGAVRYGMQLIKFI